MRKLSKPTKVRPKVLKTKVDQYNNFIENTVHLHCIDINYDILCTTRKPYTYKQQ